jgi:hypothetical protein
MSYSVNAPQKYSTSTPNATCSGYAFQTAYDNQYNVPFCQKAQMAYSGPDKVAFGIYKQTTLKENYVPSYNGYNLAGSYLMLGNAGQPGCGCGCK